MPFLDEKYNIYEGWLFQKKQKNYIFIGNWGDGHAVVPGEVLEKIMRAVIENKSLKKGKEIFCSFDELKLLSKEEMKSVLSGIKKDIS